MSRSHKDLVAFYNSLPSWAQPEFQRLLQLAEQRPFEEGELATVIQDFINRLEKETDSGEPPVLQ